MQSENGDLIYREDDDPRYRRMRPSHFPPYVEDTSQKELIKKHLPHVRLTCWIGLVLTTLFSIDYFLTPNTFQENILGVTWINRGYGVQFCLIRTPNQTIKVYSGRAASFRKGGVMIVKKSRILKTVMAIETIDSSIKIDLAYVYKTLLFFPIVLFFTSLLGLMKWGTFEFPFSLSIVTSILLVINVVLIFK